MELFRNILFIYAFASLIVSGGFLFNRQNKTHQYLGIFILIFALETMDFLYVTGELTERYPEFHMVLYPICLLAGPMLYFHLKSLCSQIDKPFKHQLLHCVPFLLFVFFTAYLMTFKGSERIIYTNRIYLSVIQPLNYIKSILVLVYAVLILLLFLHNKRLLSFERRQYFLALTIIYAITAVSVTILTALMVSYRYFIVYFMTTALTTLMTGYVLYFKPGLLSNIREKYANSGLGGALKDSIVKKVNTFFENPDNILNPKLTLYDLSLSINEKKHHISQVLSDEMKTNFNDFLNEKRISYAKRLLENPERKKLKMFAVALESGFTNKSTFYRSFLKFEKCSPNEYRNQKTVSNN